MREAKQGDTIRVHFTGHFDDGTQFTTTSDKEPVEFDIGGGKLIRHFENRFIGMKVGEEAAFRLPAADALGERKPELVYKIPRHLIPKGGEKLKVGSVLQLKDKNGTPFKATITELTQEEAVIDANHVLAGKALNFKAELVEII